MPHSAQRKRQPAHWLLLALLIAATSACNRDSKSGDSSDRGHDHDHDHGEQIASLGRLVISEAGLARVHVFDLDSSQPVATFDSQYPSTALNTSPDRRYAVLIQRDNDVVEFLDGGIWREDHGDHLHDYKEAPTMLDLALPDRRPTHYEIHGGQAALFFDGSATPFVPAKISVLSDASLGDGSELASLNFNVNMHGTAEPRGDFLLTTYRDPASTSTLPEAVELYRRQGVGYSFVERFSETCPDLHGSYSNHRFTLFGCSDGVLAVEQDGSNFSARKLPNPSSMPAATRVGTLVGHENLDTFIGIAGQALFVIDPASGSLTPLDWTNGASVTRIAHGIDASGEHFLILDSAGLLKIFNTGDWTLAGSVQVIDQFQTGNNPALAVSQADSVAYLTDPAENAVQVVDLEALSVSPLALDFIPSKLTWIGKVNAPE